MSYEKNLKKICEQNGLNQTLTALSDAVAERKIAPERISIRRLAEAFLGDNWFDNLRAYQTGRALTEAAAGEAVDGSAFTAITGQLLVNEIKDKYQLQSIITDKLATTIPVVNGNLGEQKVPYLSDVTLNPAKGNIVEEGMPYPQTTFTGQFITYPQIKKVGKICAVTAEAIYADLTTQILDSARSVGTYVSMVKMYDILKIMLGLDNTYKFNGVNYNTYQASAPWINLIENFSLVDWTSVNQLLTLSYNMLDPVTQQPIEIGVNSMFVMPNQVMQAKVILNATSVSKGAFSQSDVNQVRGDSANPLDSYALLTSQYAYKLLIDSGLTPAQANSYTFLGDPKSAFVVRSAKPLTVVEAPPLAPLDFNQDIALAVKASEWFTAGIRDPRYMFLGRNL
jgi:hypothetical protein